MMAFVNECKHFDAIMFTRHKKSLWAELFHYRLTHCDPFKVRSRCRESSVSSEVTP